jgi:CheY-like chemotaxis protein
LAKELEKAGEYEAACEALSEFWSEGNEQPSLQGLDPATEAEVLLRVGALAGWLGSVRQSEGTQEAAKNLITRSIESFAQLDQSERVAEARTELALCYWREGGFDEARLILADVLGRLEDTKGDLKALALIRAGIVEEAACRLNDALRIYASAAPLLQHSKDHALRGKFHNGFALVLRDLATAEDRKDYVDRSLIEYAAASFHFEQAGHTRYQACVENNLGFLFFTLGRYPNAHQHLDRARNLFFEIGDQVHLAQVNDTQARTLLAEERLTEADRFARSAVQTLEKGGEQALLAEALTTYGTVQARLGRHPSARTMLQRAIELAETAGDPEGAARAGLSIIEELAEQTSAVELASIFKSAADLLQRSQDPSAAKRLISCARKVIDAFDSLDRGPHGVADSDQSGWEGFSLKKEVLTYEQAIIARALKDAQGSVTRAARLLGFTHHQSLISVINARHKELLKTRAAVRKRRSHIFSTSRKIKKQAATVGPQQSTQISILHVEDDQQIGKLVQEMFPAEEWRIELCSDGYGALEKLTGSDHYDVVLVDNELPGLSGLELVQRARKITHRRRTPIVMLSGSDCESEAWGAGVHAFLRKPEQISELPSTITRLLEDGSRHS